MFIYCGEKPLFLCESAKERTAQKEPVKKNRSFKTCEQANYRLKISVMVTLQCYGET